MSNCMRKTILYSAKNITTSLIKALPFYIIYHDNFIGFASDKISRWNNELALALTLLAFFTTSLFIAIVFRKCLNTSVRNLLLTFSELFISTNQVILGLILYSYGALIELGCPIITMHIGILFHHIKIISFILLILMWTTSTLWLKNNMIAMQPREEHIQHLKLFMTRAASKLSRNK